MVESGSNSGDISGENATLRQVRLVREISGISDALFERLEGGQAWSLVNPKFGSPPSILLDGEDISEKLDGMAKQTPELLVRLGSFGRNSRHAASDVWTIRPPQDRNLSGFKLIVVCPRLTELVNSDNLESHKESGSIDVGLSWFKGSEESDDPTNLSELTLTDKIMKDTTASLETAKWILESLQSAEVIHAEKEV